MKGNRVGLALVYVLATLVAQGLHDHGAASDASASQHDAGCKETRSHLSGHGSPDLGHAADHCPACQYRAQHHAWPIATPTYLPTRTAALVELPPPPTRPGSSSLIKCRAPPRA